MKVISPKRLLQSVFPTVRNGSIFNASSLDLQFARTKTLDPRVTFTRASSGTYVDSQGVIRTATTNEARFDHNPTTGESLGLLVEEQRTNLLLRSEEFDNAAWTKVAGSVTANAITAPDGQTTADLFTEDSSTGQHDIRITSPTFADATAYTISIYGKANGRQLQIIFPLNTAGHGAVFDLTNGTFTLVGNTVSASILPVGNGWYRCICTATKAGGTGTNTLRILTNNGTTNNYTGDGTSGIFIWGAQLEAGSFPTSYIPTTTAAATRSADVASITGSNFSSWYRQDEGTVFASARTDATHGGTNSFPRIHAISDGTNDNVIQNYYRVLSAYTDAGYGVTTLAATQATFDTNNQRNGQSLSTAYANNDFAFAVGGSVVNTDNTGTVPTVTQLRLGARGTGLGPLNGTIRRLTYWPQRLPNTTLQQITQ